MCVDSTSAPSVGPPLKVKLKAFEGKLEMPNIATVFKQEISRLSRKEIRQQVQGLRKAATQYRSGIAMLKREVSKMQREIARLARHVGNSAAPQVSEKGANRLRFTAKGVRSHRARLSMSAADFGRLIGVTGHTIYKWEHGAARPRSRQIAALAALRTIGKREALARLEKLGAKAGRRARSKK